MGITLKFFISTLLFFVTVDGFSQARRRGPRDPNIAFKNNRIFRSVINCIEHSGNKFEVHYNMGTNPTASFNSFDHRRRRNRLNYALVSHLVVPSRFGGPRVEVFQNGRRLNEFFYLKRSLSNRQSVLNFESDLGNLIRVQNRTTFGVSELIASFNSRRTSNCQGHSVRVTR